MGPGYPIKPRKLAISLIIGLFLGVGGALAKEKLTSGFVTSRQVEEMVGLRLIS